MFATWEKQRVSEDLLKLVPWIREVQNSYEDVGTEARGKIAILIELNVTDYRKHK